MTVTVRSHRRRDPGSRPRVRGFRSTVAYGIERDRLRGELDAAEATGSPADELRLRRELVHLALGQFRDDRELLLRLEAFAETADAATLDQLFAALDI
jgi:hypothetical protein